MNDSILGCVQEYLKDCPVFDGAELRVNFLSESPVEFTIEDIPATPIVKRYADGSTVRQLQFLIASRELYSRDAVENLKASGVYDRLSDWMEEQTEAGNLPQLPQGCEAQRIEATTNGYCMAADIQQNIQRYQIQCRLLYYKEAI